MDRSIVWIRWILILGTLVAFVLPWIAPTPARAQLAATTVTLLVAPWFLPGGWRTRCLAFLVAPEGFLAERFPSARP